MGPPTAHAIDYESHTFVFAIDRTRAESVAFGPGGIIAVADRYNDDLEVYHPNGAFAYYLRTGSHPYQADVDDPGGIAFGPGGIIAVADRYEDVVEVYHPNGTYAYHLEGNPLEVNGTDKFVLGKRYSGEL